MKRIKSVVGYKWIKKDMTSSNGDCGKWRKNTWKRHKGEISLCNEGFHACKTPLQSLRYIYGDRWFVVEGKGEYLEEQGDKFVCSEMRIIKELPVKDILVEFSVWSAERSAAESAARPVWSAEFKWQERILKKIVKRYL